MKKLIIFFYAAAQLVAAHAQQPNPFIDGLIEGRSKSEFVDPRFAKPAQELKAQTKSDAPLFLVVERITRFKNQARCGRIKFWIEQPATNSKWYQLGGELNICEDGMPPWGVCPNEQMAPTNAKCADGTQPQQTEEVKAAIQAAIDRGGVSKMPKVNKK